MMPDGSRAPIMGAQQVCGHDLRAFSALPAMNVREG